MVKTASVTEYLMKCSIKDFLVNVTISLVSPLIWSHLLKKSRVENFIFLCNDKVYLSKIFRKLLIFLCALLPNLYDLLLFVEGE